MSEEKNYAPTKWADLKDNQKVRLTTSEGDIIHGTYDERSNCLRTALGVVGSSTAEGTTIEAAKPPRVLPTAPGIYTVDGKDPYWAEVFIRAETGKWITDNRESRGWVEIDDPDAYLPDNLVRFVPVFEAQDYAKRIERAKVYIASKPISLPDAHAGALLAILDGRTDGS